MTVKQERDAIKAKLWALREAVNLEEIYAVVDTQLAILEWLYGEYSGWALERKNTIKQAHRMQAEHFKRMYAAQIHNIYKGICK